MPALLKKKKKTAWTEKAKMNKKIKKRSTVK